MARVISWKLGDGEVYAYLAKKSGSTFTKGYQIGAEIPKESDDLKTVSRVVSAYSQSEYKTYFNQMAAEAKASYSVDLGAWSEYFDISGSIIMLTGAGKTGAQGKQGEKGDTGDSGVAGKGRNVMCYCGVDSGVTVTKANITGGHLDTSNWHITYPTDPNDICVWGDNNEFGSKKVVWMSNADFDNDGNLITRTDDKGNTFTWATPIRISGEKGDNGADGSNIEFIYKLVATREDKDKPAKPDNKPKVDDYVPTGWTDNPQGISEEMKAEYMCQRKKEPTDTEWSDWHGPILWASWGEDGNDGDGIEYIFAITQDYGKTAIEGKLPKSTDPELAPYWGDPEIYDVIREKGLVERYAPWTDDPSDVEETEPYEWVSIRRYDHNNKTWGEFESPKLWAHYGKNGEKGDDGTSLNVKGKYKNLTECLKDIHASADKFPPKMGDSYALGEGDDVHMWVWMGLDSSTTGQTYNPNGSYNYDTLAGDYFNTGWYYVVSGEKYWFVDCGTFKGESGYTTYVHYKYAREYRSEYGSVTHQTVNIINEDGTTTPYDLCFTVNNGEAPGPFIAMYTDTIFDDRSDFAYYCGTGDEKQKKNLWTRFKGDDGQSYGQEQIFYRTYSYNVPPTLICGTKAHGYEKGEEYLDVEYDGHFRQNDYVPAGWTDTPKGIVSGVYNFEWVSVRRLLDDGTWSYFSAPALYNEAVDTPTSQIEYSTWSGTTVPVLKNASAYTTDGVFNETKWRNDHKSTGPWSDVVSSGTTWTATANGYFENGVSGNVIWNDWVVVPCGGKDGISRYTSFVFTTAEQGVDLSKCTVTGGTYQNAKPSPSQCSGKTYTWVDSPTATGKDVIWMTSAVFSNVNGSTMEVAWSKPKNMNDTTDFETMYSAYEADALEDLPDGFKKKAGSEEIDPDWLKLANQNGWYDEPEDCLSGKTKANPVFMATNTYANTKWEGWKVVRIKGEKGEDGGVDHSLDYLKNIFGEDKVDFDNGALIRELLGVKDKNNKVTAMMNGSSAFTDNEGNTLMIAAGMDGVKNSSTAKFRVYSNGNMYAENAVINGKINANNGSIGNFTIDGGKLVGEADNGSSIIFDPKGLDIAYKDSEGYDILDINSNGMSVYDEKHDLAVQVGMKYYRNLSAFATAGNSTTAGIYTTLSVNESLIISADTKTEIPNTEMLGPEATTYEGKEVAWGSPFTVPTGANSYTVDCTVKHSSNLKSTYEGYDYHTTNGVNLRPYIYSSIIFKNTSTNIEYYAYSQYLGCDKSFNHSSNRHTVEASTASTVNLTFRKSLPSGTYQTYIKPRFEAYCQDGFGTGNTSQPNILTTSINCQYTQASMTITPNAERTELFANGFGYAFNKDGYVGAIREYATGRTDTGNQNVVFEAHNKDRGLVFDSAGLKQTIPNSTSMLPVFNIVFAGFTSTGTTLSEYYYISQLGATATLTAVSDGKRKLTISHPTKTFENCPLLITVLHDEDADGSNSKYPCCGSEYDARTTDKTSAPYKTNFFIKNVHNDSLKNMRMSLLLIDLSK